MGRAKVYRNGRKVSLESVIKHKQALERVLMHGDPYQRINADPNQAQRVAKMTAWEYIDWHPEFSRS